MGGPGHGVRRIATVLNVTRLYNAVCAVANMRRALALAADYATRRVAFGRPLAEHPLHVETLAGMATELAGAFHLTFHVGVLAGREECGTATADELLLLRLLTPIAIYAFFPSLQTMVVEIVPAKRLGIAYALQILFLGGLGQAAGPFIVGLVSDRSGSLLAGLCVPLAGLILAALLAAHAGGYIRRTRIVEGHA